MIFFQLRNEETAKAGGLEQRACGCGKGTCRVEPICLDAERDYLSKWPDLLPIKLSWPFVLSESVLNAARGSGLQLNAILECNYAGNVPKRYFSIRASTTIGIELRIENQWVAAEICECGRVTGEYAKEAQVSGLDAYRYDFSKWNGECVFAAPHPIAPFVMMCTKEFIVFLRESRPKVKMSVMPIVDGHLKLISVPYMSRNKTWIPEELSEFF